MRDQARVDTNHGEKLSLAARLQAFPKPAKTKYVKTTWLRATRKIRPHKSAEAFRPYERYIEIDDDQPSIIAWKSSAGLSRIQAA